MALSLDSCGPVKYTDLRMLIDTDPPQYEHEHEEDEDEERHRLYIYRGLGQVRFGDTVCYMEALTECTNNRPTQVIVC